MREGGRSKLAGDRGKGGREEKREEGGGEGEAGGQAGLNDIDMQCAHDAFSRALTSQ